MDQGEVGVKGIWIHTSTRLQFSIFPKSQYLQKDVQRVDSQKYQNNFTTWFCYLFLYFTVFATGKSSLRNMSHFFMTEGNV